MASTARIDELQKKFDENPRRYFAPLANEYRKSGQIDRAIALCREHLRKQPGHMSGHIVYGQALYEIGEREEARRVFQSALDLDPENVIALRHMGDIEREGGRADEARRWYTRVLDADPHDAQVTSLINSLEISSEIPLGADDAALENERVEGELEQFPVVSGPDDAFGDDAFAYPPIDAPLDLEVVSADQSLLTATAGEMPGGRSDGEGADLNAPDASASSGERGGALDALVPVGAELSGAPAAAEGEDEAVLPIEAFGYDAEHEAAATASAELPSIDTFAYDTTAGDGDDEVWSEVPSIEAFGYDEPSIDEFLLDVQEDGELALPSLAETAEAPSAPPEIVVVAEIDVIETVVVDVTAIEVPEEVPETGHRRDEEPAGAAAEHVAPEVVGGSRDAASGVGSPFVTETMAELYLRQGFRDEALGVYRQLLASDPYNVAISAKVRELTGEFPSVVPDAGVASTPAAERARVDVAPEAAVEMPTASSTPPHGDVLAAASGSGGSAGTPVLGVAPGTSARAFFASLLTQRPRRTETHRPEVAADQAPQAREVAGPGDAVAASDVESRSETEAAAGDAHASTGLGFGAEDLDSFIEPPLEAAGPEGELLMIESYSYDPGEEPGVGGAAGATTLDALFGHAPVAAEDSAAASALAAAFGAAAADAAADAAGDAHEAAGRPARPATTELSLDEIFRGGANDVAAARRTTPTAFSFDQFFTDEAPTGTLSGGAPEAAPSSRLGEESAGDLEQFNAWLEGLKRK